MSDESEKVEAFFEGADNVYTGLAFPDDGFTLTETDIFVMSDESEKVEAFFEGADNVYDGAQVNFSSQKIIIREKGDATKHSYTNKQIATP